MPIEIHELIIRVTVVESETPAPNWEALQRRLKAEVLEQCQERIETALQRTAER